MQISKRKFTFNQSELKLPIYLTTIRAGVAATETYVIKESIIFTGY